MIIEDEKVEIIEDEEKLKEKKNTTPKKKNPNSKKPAAKTTVENSKDVSDLPMEQTKDIQEETEESQNIKEEKPKNVVSKNQIISTVEPNNVTDSKFSPIEDVEEIEEEVPKKKKHWGFVFLTFLSILVCLLLAAFLAFAFYNYKHNNVISKGIYINSIDVSGLTKEEAKQKVQEYYTEKLSNDIALSYQDYTTYIKTSEIELNYDIDSSVDYAFNYGKTNGIFYDNYEIFNAMISGLKITPTYTFNEASLTQILNSFSGELPGALVESGYYVEDNKLIITKGSTGVIINIPDTINQIQAKLPNADYTLETIPLAVITQNPKEPNIDEIYNEVHKDPKDAYYTKDPFTVYPSENGVDFKISIDEAKEKVASSEGECEIPLKVLSPSVTTDMIGQEAFPDLLGSFQTNYVSNADRTTNLRLAANKINGKVLMPGEVFSYNGVVGARTIAAGYKNAAIYQNGQVVDGIGGGICQISSTLFNAALFANLEIVELHNHQFVPSYVTAGRDATVVYGVKDFKFKNTRNYPIKIACSVSGGVASFKIWGLREENEYDVSVYANVSRTSSYIKSTTYRTLKQNGETIKTEKIYNATYKTH